MSNGNGKSNGKSRPRMVNKKAFRSRANDYTLEELEAFTKATYKAYLSIISSKPDGVIAPLRGAEPLMKVINMYAADERKTREMPRVYYPRLGQISLGAHGKVIDKTLPGFLQSQTETEQTKELRRMLDSILKKAKKDGKKRIHLTFVDEVRHGGSISQAVEMIEKLMAKSGTGIPVSISLIAIAENKAYRSASYNSLKSRIHVKEFNVPRVFTMDSANSLFPLLKEKNPYWPFNTRLKLGITKKAIKGRQELLEDITALRLMQTNSMHHSFLGRTQAVQRIKRIPKR